MRCLDRHMQVGNHAAACPALFHPGEGRNWIAVCRHGRAISVWSGRCVRCRHIYIASWRAGRQGQLFHITEHIVPTGYYWRTRARRDCQFSASSSSRCVSTLLLAAAAAKRTIIHSSLNDVFSVIRALAAAAAAADDNDKPLSLSLSLWRVCSVVLSLFVCAHYIYAYSCTRQYERSETAEFLHHRWNRADKQDQ